MFHSALLLCFRDKLYLGSLTHYLAPSRKGKRRRGISLVNRVALFIVYVQYVIFSITFGEGKLIKN